MKVLLVHNAYKQRGGEDSVVEAEAALLRTHGHTVIEHRRHNDEIDGLSQAALAQQTLWSRDTARSIAAQLERERPDLVHVHNTFPLISPSLYWACASAGVPVVQTLHNFRLACPQGMFLRDGAVCEGCSGRLPWRGVVHGCYRGSRAQTAVLAGMLVLHRALGTWQHKVARYIALNEFCRRKFVDAGLPAQRVVVKPNFVDCPPPAQVARTGVLFVGRLSSEKGVDVLAQAWSASPAGTLRVAGTGPQAPLLEGLPRVQMLGPLPLSQVFWEMGRATALVIPSTCHENFPRTLVEAFACGLPVIASRLGALAELIDDGRTGLLFEPGDATDLARKLQWAAAHPQELAAMGRRARAHYEAHYTAQRNHEQLMAIYRDAGALQREGAVA